MQALRIKLGCSLRALLLLLSVPGLISLRRGCGLACRSRSVHRPALWESASISEGVRNNPVSGEYDFEYWSKAFVSQPSEFNYALDPEEIEGQLPSSFSGTLYRMMPARFERGGTQYAHYLDGDGYCIR